MHTVFAAGAVLLAGVLGYNSVAAGDSAMKIKVHEENISGERVVIMENAYFKSIMVPGKAMLPATYFYKPTGHDVFLRRAKLEESYSILDGLYDCLPWVGDSKKRGASKGLLRTATWQVKTEQNADQAAATFSTEISYADFTTGKTNRLSFTKKIAGASGNAQLRMDYSIQNTGTEKAKFICVGHARVAAGGAYDNGDYVYMPGTNCWVTEFKWAALAQMGVQPYSWTRWPIKGVIDFTLKEGADKQGEYVYAFVPASWAVVGDEKSREYVVFHCSPITLGGTVMPQPYWCILHRDGDYLLEMSLSRDIDAKNWDEPWATVALAPGETARFTVCLTPGQGLVRSDFEAVTEATADRLVFGGAPGTTNKVLRLAP